MIVLFRLFYNRCRFFRPLDIPGQEELKKSIPLRTLFASGAKIEGAVVNEDDPAWHL
jgi:hypothetical protein